MFREISAEVVRAATDIAILEKLTPDFEAVRVKTVSDGVARITDPHTILWEMDAAQVNPGNVVLESLGRIVQVDLTIKAVCPGKRVGVSVILNELDLEGIPHPRGVKHILIPAQTGEGCRDIRLRCIPFSVPEALNPSGNTESICSSRNFAVQAIANYVDTDFTCCKAEAIL